MKNEIEKQINVLSDYLFIIRNFRMGKRIQTDGAISFQTILDTVKAMARYPGLSREQVKEVRDYYYPYKVSTLFHREIYDMIGVFDPRIIPDEIYYAYINPYFNDMKKTPVLENKCLYPRIFKGIPQPKTVCLRINGIQLDDKYQLMSDQKLRKLLEKHEAIFVKAAEDSYGGVGVHYLKRDKENPDLKKMLTDIFNETDGDLIVQEPVRQHPATAKLNPSSVNTFRVVSILFPDEVKVYPGFFRIGRAGKAIDNGTAGGVLCGYNMDGKLQKYGITNYQYVEKHPDSGITFDGYQLPCFDKVVKAVKKAHPLIPTSRLVSWDFCVDENSEPVMIEANLANGGIGVQYFHRPMFGEDSKAIIDMALKDSDYPRYK